MEMASRIRRYVGLASHLRYDRPLIIVVPKADVWGRIIDLDLSTEPFSPPSFGGSTPWTLDLEKVQSVSASVRAFLMQSAPEFVTAAEDFCQHVVYIPVSALGHSPQRQANQEGLLVRPSEIHPKWATIPMLYVFAKWSKGLIAGTAASGKPHQPTPSVPNADAGAR